MVNKTKASFVQATCFKWLHEIALFFKTFERENYRQVPLTWSSHRRGRGRPLRLHTGDGFLIGRLLLGGLDEGCGLGDAGLRDGGGRGARRRGAGGVHRRPCAQQHCGEKREA